MKRIVFTAMAITLAGCGSTPPSATETQSTIQSETGVAASHLDTDSGSTLVAYFSVTGHTEGIATMAKDHLGCDAFEIVPTQEYTSEDIDYNSDCRANREQNDESARPEIRNRIGDISAYDTIVLGYPIWWGQAPKIMYTFLESYDFGNKAILPFCTSGSSPIGNSATNLSKSDPKANWLEGKRFAASASKESVGEWLDENLGRDAKEEKNEMMDLFIDNRKVDVSWEDNDSVKELKELSRDGLTIQMNEYGGFEQTGPIGRAIKRADRQIDTKPGDIVLYGGDDISVFYGTNSWSYTMLGHINLSQEELVGILKKSNVTFVLKGE